MMTCVMPTSKEWYVPLAPGADGGMLSPNLAMYCVKSSALSWLPGHVWVGT